MNYEEARMLQPGDRVHSVGDIHFTGLFGFNTNGVILHVSDNLQGIMVEIQRDADKERIWVTTRHVTEYTLEGERRAWREKEYEDNGKKKRVQREAWKRQREEWTTRGFNSGPFDRDAMKDHTYRDLDPDRRMSKHSFAEVRLMLRKLYWASGGSNDTGRRIFHATGLEHIRFIQPWQHDPIYGACAAKIEKYEIDDLM
jgi:hypothetical protein